MTSERVFPSLAARTSMAASSADVRRRAVTCEGSASPARASSAPFIQCVDVVPGFGFGRPFLELFLGVALVDLVEALADHAPS